MRLPLRAFPARPRPRHLAPAAGGRSHGARSEPASPPLRAQVAPVSEDEVFKVIKSGKRKKKQWKRMVNKVRWEGVACCDTRRLQ
jgi:hypothetical protein